MRSGYLLALIGYTTAVPLFTFTGIPTGIPTAYPTDYLTGYPTGYPTGYSGSYPTGVPFDGTTYHVLPRRHLGGPRHRHHFANGTSYPTGATAAPHSTGYAIGTGARHTLSSLPTGFALL